MKRLECKRTTCKHKWFQRTEKKPECCPKCHSRLWEIKSEEKK